jgi:tetratricopeptide (TPR) repeat protein
MDGLSREDLDRLHFFQVTREEAEEVYKHSPEDADNLTRWGGALMELAQVPGVDSTNLMDEAAAKLQMALKVNPKKHDALWCLGNVHTQQGFMVREASEANKYFDKANALFQRALDEEPNNPMYKHGLEMSTKAPGLFQELHEELRAREAEITPASSGAASGPNVSARQKKKQADSDFKYDVIGWVVMIGIAVTWLGVAASRAAPTPASTSSQR